MRWPPNKAWTSTSSKKGYRHFVAINYGGKGEGRWINLVSVLDGKTTLKVPWKEMKDSSLWKTGWEQICREDLIQCSEALKKEQSKNQIINDNQDACLHPSEDSGLLIPSKDLPIRPWF